MRIENFSIEQPNLPESSSQAQGSTPLSLCLPNGCSESDVFFYDIETTGSERATAQVYLIGMSWTTADGWCGRQLLIENADEEKELLVSFAEFLKEFRGTVQYYGSRFDEPFLVARCQQYGLENPFHGLPSIDLYQAFKPLQRVLNVSNLKQTTLEQAIGVPSREYPDGRKCLQIFEAAKLQARPAYTEALLGHNREDLVGMLQILPLLTVLQLKHPECLSVLAVSYEEDALTWHLNVPQQIPLLSEFRNDFCVLTITETDIVLTIPVLAQRIRQFYPNYKEYEYLPAEDSVVPKSISSCMPKSQRQKARPDNCYTWVTVTEAFLRNFEQQDQYVRHNLPLLLAL